MTTTYCDISNFNKPLALVRASARMHDAAIFVSIKARVSQQWQAIARKRNAE
jgi:hypothetical protein